MEPSVLCCSLFRFNFRHTAGLLLRNASTDKPCPCKSRPSSNRFPAERENARASVEASPSPLVHGDTETPRDGKRAGGRAPSGRTVAACSKKMTLLAYEMEYVIKAYTWIAQNRRRTNMGTDCSERLRPWVSSSPLPRTCRVQAPRSSHAERAGVCHRPEVEGVRDQNRLFRSDPESARATGPGLVQPHLQFPRGRM
ncbi:hypothetical protein KUCAC02_025109 [Chaenocephalus aceratus]|nr:hypothetical protein KUCAC02_025109 [Chaenocephalus aceratus]